MNNEFETHTVTSLMRSLERQKEESEAQFESVTQNCPSAANKPKITRVQLDKIIENARESCNLAAKVIETKIRDYADACDRPSVQRLCHLQHQQLQVLDQMVKIRMDMVDEERKSAEKQTDLKNRLSNIVSSGSSIANTMSFLQKTAEKCCPTESSPSGPKREGTFTSSKKNTPSTSSAFKSRLPRWQPHLQKNNDSYSNLSSSKNFRMRSGCCDPSVKPSSIPKAISCFPQKTRTFMHDDSENNSSKDTASEQDSVSCGPCTCNDPPPRDVDEITGSINGNEFAFKVHRNLPERRKILQETSKVKHMKQNILPLAFKVYPTHATIFPPSCVTPEGKVRTTLANSKSFKLCMGKVSAGNDDGSAGVDIELRRAAEDDVPEDPETSNMHSQYLEDDVKENNGEKGKAGKKTKGGKGAKGKGDKKAKGGKKKKK